MEQLPLPAVGVLVGGSGVLVGPVGVFVAGIGVLVGPIGVLVGVGPPPLVPTTFCTNSHQSMLPQPLA